MACLRDASRLDYGLLDRPRSKNFHFPLLFQKLLFKSCLYERSITPLCNRHFDFERWVKEGGCVYMASYTAFQPYDYAWISRLFVPVDEIMGEVENRCRNFSDAMIGVHIRRTDNLASIRQSPIELFYQKLDEKIKENGKVAIYLATDSEEVKREMKERYGDRIFCSGKKADRGSLEGIREGITDMYTLARTQKIYGSFQSSFSDMAAQIGGVPLEILKL